MDLGYGDAYVPCESPPESLQKQLEERSNRVKGLSEAKARDKMHS